MKHLLFYSSILLFCFSCKKENSKKWTEIKITVTDYLTGAPIEDVTCALYEKNSLGNLDLIYQSSTTTGLFEYGFKANGNKQYVVTSSAPNDKYYMVSFLPYLELYKFQKNEFTFSTVGYGFLKLDIQNQACFNTDDKLIFKRENLSLPNDETNWSNERLGCYTYTSPDYFIVPVGTHKYSWQVTKNNIMTEYSAEIIVTEGAFLTFNLYY
ncbi:MAG: hypothetical protein IPO32_07905 [Crocinitomicaceae bacterium]|nr:hypothetical protein [Crocinitomicaceae bacterium]